jgi:hypothetical protein
VLADGRGTVDVDAGPAFLVRLERGRQVETEAPPNWVRHEQVSRGVQAAYERAWSEPVRVCLGCRLRHAARAAETVHAYQQAEAARLAAEKQRHIEAEAAAKAEAHARAAAEAAALREATQPGHDAHVAEMTRSFGPLADIRKQRDAVEGERWRAHLRLQALERSADDLFVPGLTRSCLVLGVVISALQLVLAIIVALLPLGVSGIALAVFVGMSVAVTLVLVRAELRARLGEQTPLDEVPLPYALREHSRLSTWAEDVSTSALVGASLFIVLLQLLVGVVLRAGVLFGWQDDQAGALHVLTEGLVVGAAAFAFLRTRARLDEDRARAREEDERLQSQREEMTDLIGRFRCGQPGCPFCAVM